MVLCTVGNKRVLLVAMIGAIVLTMHRTDCLRGDLGKKHLRREALRSFVALVFSIAFFLCVATVRIPMRPQLMNLMPFCSVVMLAKGFKRIPDLEWE